MTGTAARTPSPIEPAVEDDSTPTFERVLAVFESATDAKPFDPAHVLGMAAFPGQNQLGVFESQDGGLTYAGPLFSAPPGAVLTGMEIAASDPAIWYVTFYETPGTHPRLARSDDGGGSWTVFDAEPTLGEVIPFVAAVDAGDSQVVYLRLSGRGSGTPFEGLGIAREGGATFSARRNARLFSDARSFGWRSSNST